MAAPTSSSHLGQFGQSGFVVPTTLAVDGQSPAICQPPAPGQLPALGQPAAVPPPRAPFAPTGQSAAHLRLGGIADGVGRCVYDCSGQCYRLKDMCRKNARGPWACRRCFTSARRRERGVASLRGRGGWPGEGWAASHRERDAASLWEMEHLEAAQFQSALLESALEAGVEHPEPAGSGEMEGETASSVAASSSHINWEGHFAAERGQAASAVDRAVQSAASE